MLSARTRGSGNARERIVIARTALGRQSMSIIFSVHEWPLSPHTVGNSFLAVDYVLLSSFWPQRLAKETEICFAIHFTTDSFSHTIFGFLFSRIGKQFLSLPMIF